MGGRHVRSDVLARRPPPHSEAATGFDSVVASVKLDPRCHLRERGPCRWFVGSAGGSLVVSDGTAGHHVGGRAQGRWSSKIRLPQFSFPFPAPGTYCVASQTLFVPVMIWPFE